MTELMKLLDQLDCRLGQNELQNHKTTRKVLLITITQHDTEEEEKKESVSLQGIVSSFKHHSMLNDIKMSYFKGEGKWLILPENKSPYQIMFNIENHIVKDLENKQGNLGNLNVLQLLIKRISDSYKEYDGFTIFFPDNYLEYISNGLSFGLMNLAKTITMVDYRLNIMNNLHNRAGQVQEAIFIAGSFEIPEVCFLKYGKLMRGCRLSKDKERQFHSPNYPSLGYVSHCFFRPKWQHIMPIKHKEDDLIPFYDFEENIVNIKLSPFINYKVLKRVVEKAKPKAILIETYGVGECPMSHQDFHDFCGMIKELNIPAIGITQCLKGYVTNIYENNIFQFGIKPAHDLTKPTALTKLSYLLGVYKNKETIERLMVTDLVGELTVQVNKGDKQVKSIKEDILGSLLIDNVVKDELFDDFVLSDYFLNAIARNKLNLLKQLSNEDQINSDSFKLKTAEGCNILHLFAKEGDNDLFSFFLKFISREDLKKLANTRDSSNLLPLYYAITNKNKNAIVILKKLTDAELVTKNNIEQVKNDVFRAIDLKDLDQLKFFYFGGVKDFNALCTETGVNPLHYAIFQKFDEFFKFLKTEVPEFNFNQKDITGKSALDYYDIRTTI